MDLSPLVEVTGREDLERLRGGVRGTPIEGLMLKRKDSPYLAGRPKGLWWKWKRDAHLLDVVLMYAQRGHGKRSSFYSDFTFGAWRDGAGRPGAGPRRQGLFRLHRRRAASDRPLDPRPYHQALRPGARGDAGPGAGGRLRLRPPVHPAQVRGRHALSPHPPDQMGQAGRRGGPAGEPGAADQLTVACCPWIG